LVFITELKSVYCGVRTGPLNEEACASSLKGECERRDLLQMQYTMVPVLAFIKGLMKARNYSRNM